MIYATGDTHGNFQRFAPEHFPEQAGMTKEDYMIICGDFWRRMGRGQEGGAEPGLAGGLALYHAVHQRQP